MTVVKCWLFFNKYFCSTVKIILLLLRHYVTLENCHRKLDMRNFKSKLLVLQLSSVSVNCFIIEILKTLLVELKPVVIFYIFIHLSLDHDPMLLPTTKTVHAQFKGNFVVWFKTDRGTNSSLMIRWFWQLFSTRLLFKTRYDNHFHHQCISDNIGQRFWEFWLSGRDCK